MISDEDIRRVREATDLVDLVSEAVVLKQKGREFWGRCPFHEEKTPSFKVDPRSQLYHCFGCNAGGDAYGFVMRTQSMEFIDAVRSLADRANITLVEEQNNQQRGKRTRLLDLMLASAEYYALQLQRSKDAGAQAARSYLSRRAMGTELAKRWQMGYAPGGTRLWEHLRSKGYTLEECIEANVVISGSNNRPRDRFYQRVIFPVADLQSRIIAFGGRIIDQGEPKYLNSSETALFHKRETLYAIDKAKVQITNKSTAIVVEGYTDTIAMHEAGFVNTVATLGTALTLQHLKLLNRFTKKVIYLFDGDEAGKRAAVRASELINKDLAPEAGLFRVVLEVAELPAGMDPADFLAREGAAALQEILDKATPLLKYAIQQSLANADISTPEGRSAALRSALTVLLPIRGTVLATDYIAGELAPQLGVDYVAATNLFNGMQAPRTAQASGERAAAATTSGAASDTSSGQRASSGSESNTAAAVGTGTGSESGAVLSGADARSSGNHVAGVGSKIEGARGGFASGGQPSSIELQNELIILYLEYLEVRPLLARAFERISWESEELVALSQGLIAADKQAESSELYALALELVPTSVSVLSAGLQQSFLGEASDYAYLLMYMLRELQLQNEIALAKIVYTKASAGAEGDALFKEIAEKQSELATIRERLVEIPKTLL